ncbi:MAG TPA: biopolymer transporter ExbD [Candidatus Cloacimonadota bacterium]|jgi:hypothetical protein|nr:biopolymer transporter ExbD [Candidatus Cloacimonadota bacterium]
MPYRPSAGRNQRLAGGPKEPDLVPIMNLFLTIIPFMLYMLVITQLALIALNFAPSGGGGGGGQGPGGDAKAEEKKIEVYIMNQDAPDRGLIRGFEVREPGMENIKVPFVNGNYDFVRLDQILKDIRARNPEQREINVSPYPDVLYGPLIQTIDLSKSNGFINVMFKPTDVGYI